jgi:hypothetical protein
MTAPFVNTPAETGPPGLPDKRIRIPRLTSSCQPESSKTGPDPKKLRHLTNRKARFTGSSAALNCLGSTRIIWPALYNPVYIL